MKLDYELKSVQNELLCGDALSIAEELAKPFEHCFLKAYHDPVGFPTQGWGHLLSRKKWEDLSKYKPWTQQYADSVLRQDMRKSQEAVRRLCPVKLTANQEAALIDFTFNCGAGNLQSSTLRKCVLRGDFEQAANEFLKWDKAQGVKLRGLTKRRVAESKLFRS